MPTRPRRKIRIPSTGTARPTTGRESSPPSVRRGDFPTPEPDRDGRAGWSALPGSRRPEDLDVAGTTAVRAPRTYSGALIGNYHAAVLEISPVRSTVEGEVVARRITQRTVRTVRTLPICHRYPWPWPVGRRWPSPRLGSSSRRALTSAETADPTRPPAHLHSRCRRSATAHGCPGRIAVIERHVLDLHEVDETQVAVVGGKGAHLGGLSRIDGVRGPGGFCVTTDAFRRLMGQVPCRDHPWARPARRAGRLRRPIQRDGRGPADGLVRRPARHVPQRRGADGDRPARQPVRLHDVVRTNQVDDQLIARRKDAFRWYHALTRPRVLTSDGEAVTVEILL